MRDFYVFDIPVYRCRKEQYEIEMNDAAEKQKRTSVELALGGLPSNTKISRELLMSIEDNAWRAFGGPWQFNQIVGWVRVFPQKNSIAAHIWFVEGKRLTRRMQKLFYLRSMSACPVNFSHPPADSSQILHEILSGLEDLAGQVPLKGRYLDLSVFRRIAPFVDWRRLIDDAGASRLG